MDKNEYKKQRQITLQKQEQFLIDNPEIGKWVKMKKLLFRLLAGYWIFHTVISIIIMAMQQMLTVSEITRMVFMLLFQLLWMAAFMNPRGGWRLNLILYISAAYNLLMLVKNGAIMMETASYLPYMPLTVALTYGVLMLMEILVPFLLLAAAIYLTAFSNHREWSEQAEEMYKETFQELQDTVKK
ncbi:MAG: hypothetical protein K2N85_14340 [Lachnospiraceae bacterium]|nr:hypothetical protein [Lachnospiraceae bacterium]